VLVAAVYDPAYYYTPKEIHEKGENIDVPTVVEDPKLSLCDQLQYIKCRRECLLGLHEVLLINAGLLAHDVLHGDGPAMQFEAGNKVLLLCWV
jgi:hypothetical protein